ncbi:hypothetical protein COLO4_04944 [Corchorus olitorius]|uniref:Uncharacterized protein n=1 Tax=Corchorus olitorius TaxID=93759 RepID=A0A1R3KSF0_9ROSI|nr:hypothetical protein COLO4_04944 [Corchorus olitorius]
MAAEATLSFSVASVVENVLQRHVFRSKDLDLESRKAEKAAKKRNEVECDDLLYGGIEEVVESPCDAALTPDGAALSAFQYFENVRNILVAGQELGLPTFEASDLELEQGAKSSRVVNCVMALKSYNE